MDRRRRVEGLRLKGIGSPLRIWAGIWTGRFGPEDRFAIPQGLGDRHNGLVNAFADDGHNGDDDWQQEHDRIRHERDQGEAFLKRPRTARARGEHSGSADLPIGLSQVRRAVSHRQPVGYVISARSNSTHVKKLRTCEKSAGNGSMSKVLGMAAVTW